MIEQKISIILGLWSEGFFSDSEVVTWADKNILEANSSESSLLIDLSLDGPFICSKKPSYEFPSKFDFSYEERFSIKLAMLNFASDSEIRKFVVWAAKNAMGGDLESKFVQLGYHLDHYIDYDEIDPITYFKNNIGSYLPISKAIVDNLLEQANA